MIKKGNKKRELRKQKNNYEGKIKCRIKNRLSSKV